MEMVNAIMAIVIYAVRGYPGYLVLKNDNEIQIFTCGHAGLHIGRVSANELTFWSAVEILISYD